MEAYMGKKGGDAEDGGEGGGGGGGGGDGGGGRSKGGRGKQAPADKGSLDDDLDSYMKKPAPAAEE